MNFVKSISFWASKTGKTNKIDMYCQILSIPFSLRELHLTDPCNSDTMVNSESPTNLQNTRFGKWQQSGQSEYPYPLSTVMGPEMGTWPTRTNWKFLCELCSVNTQRFTPVKWQTLRNMWGQTDNWLSCQKSWADSYRVTDIKNTLILPCLKSGLPLMFSVKPFPPKRFPFNACTHSGWFLSLVIERVLIQRVK